ncbi:MAG: polysaccharide biosynthesis protein [Lachnospiraceae bacterium]|nr:polysaccharide biosynthesis protein [Lachnospiraceae bacterium]
MFKEIAPQKKQKYSRIAFLIIMDIIVVNIVSLFSIYVRFDFKFNEIDSIYWESLINIIPWYTPMTIACFAICRLYSSLWRFASIREALNVFFGVTLSSIAQFIIMHILDVRVPRSYYVFNYILLMLCIMATRFAYRLLRYFNSERRSKKSPERHSTMVIGAGSAGTMIIKEMITSQYLDDKIQCIIDDNQGKWGRFVYGIKVVGGRDYIPEAVDKYNITDIIIAMPSASAADRREIIDICNTTGCNLKILPGMYQVVRGEVTISSLREVQIEDLLEREPIDGKIGTILEYVKDQVILVTGGGGSIGSELCRQIAKHEPKQLIIFDIYENNAYDIQQELKRKYPELDLVVLIGSVRNTNRMDYLFATYRPDIVYHAAAHKHVPLMEDSPNEAIKNNVLGTLKTAQMADKYGVKKFVLISTDKAVNPTNIMGASKRICEMIVQTINNHSKTEFVAVRFGNVLGSNGSVIPLFKKQIAEGGPVTVTHPDIIRYFMTIPEAVSLVLQAGASAKGGEIFVLDMGEPVKILDLATNLIRLSGFKPNEDIKIEFTGLRPGEKLYEEMLMDEEGMQETANKRIKIGHPIPVDEETFFSKLEELRRAATAESADIRRIVKEIVPEYRLKNDTAMQQAAVTKE